MTKLFIFLCISETEKLVVFVPHTCFYLWLTDDGIIDLDKCEDNCVRLKSYQKYALTM